MKKSFGTTLPFVSKGRTPFKELVCKVLDFGPASNNKVQKWKNPTKKSPFVFTLHLGKSR